MEQSVSNNEPTNPNPKPHPLTALAFMEIGLFEIVFVIVGVLLLLGTINYFNLLPVSEVFPKYLSWLPRQTKIASPGETLQTQREVPSGTSPRPTISPEETAKKLLYSFASENLNPSIAPSLSDMIFKQDDTEKNTFTVSWTKQTGTSSATFALSQDQSISYLYMNNIYNIDSKTVVTSQLAEEITPMFFSIEPKGKWGCKPIYENTYCENFWEENGIAKKGISISGPFILSNRQAIITVSICEFGKTSSLYSRKSCTTEFADTGIANN